MRRRSGRKHIEIAKWFESARLGTELARLGTESAQLGIEPARVTCNGAIGCRVCAMECRVCARVTPSRNGAPPSNNHPAKGTCRFSPSCPDQASTNREAMCKRVLDTVQLSQDIHTASITGHIGECTMALEPSQNKTAPSNRPVGRYDMWAGRLPLRLAI